MQLVQRYQDEGRQRELAELTRRSEQQTAELRQRELQQRWLWTLLAGVALALAGDRRVRRCGCAASAQSSRRQTRILRSVLDGIGDSVLVVDERGELLMLNPAAEALAGPGLTHRAEGQLARALRPVPARPRHADAATASCRWRARGAASTVDKVDLYMRLRRRVAPSRAAG